jgi:hypothetical protein
MDKMASVIHLFVPTGFSKNLSDSSSWPGGMGGHASMRICTSRQGLTLVHFSAQREPFLTQNTP